MFYVKDINNFERHIPTEREEKETDKKNIHKLTFVGFYII